MGFAYHFIKNDDLILRNKFTVFLRKFLIFFFFFFNFFLRAISLVHNGKLDEANKMVYLKNKSKI